MNKLHASCSTLLCFVLLLSGCVTPGSITMPAPMPSLQPTEIAQPTQTQEATGDKTPIPPSTAAPCPSETVMRPSLATPTPLVTPASTAPHPSPSDTEHLNIVGQIDVST